MKRQAKDMPPAPVTAVAAKQVEKPLVGWTSVWTERMLTALEDGVKGGECLLCCHGLFSIFEAHG